MSSWGRMQFCSLHVRLKVSTSSKLQLAEGRRHGWDARQFRRGIGFCAVVMVRSIATKTKSRLEIHVIETKLHHCTDLYSVPSLLRSTACATIPYTSNRYVCTLFQPISFSFAANYFKLATLAKWTPQNRATKYLHRSFSVHVRTRAD